MGKGENEVATVAKYLRRVPRGAQAGMPVLLDGKGKSKRAGKMPAATAERAKAPAGGQRYERQLRRRTQKAMSESVAKSRAVV
jgi:hypothetical protein